MFYKILLIFYTIMLVVQIKNLINFTPVKQQMDEAFEKYEDDNDLPLPIDTLLFIVYTVMSILITIPLVIFYFMSYNLSVLIGWLSILQFFLAMRNMWVGITLIQRYREYRLNHNIKLLWASTTFDVIYLLLIIQALIMS